MRKKTVYFCAYIPMHTRMWLNIQFLLLLFAGMMDNGGVKEDKFPCGESSDCIWALV